MPNFVHVIIIALFFKKYIEQINLFVIIEKFLDGNRHHGQNVLISINLIIRM